MIEYHEIDKRRNEYLERGFLMFRELFSPQEIDALRIRAKSDRAMDEHAYGRNDGEGGKIRLSLWNQPGDGIYGAFARSRRMVTIAQVLLGDEPYHYHSKMIMKDARVGGAWAWHQDYGYWYHNAVLKPDLVSAFVAVDAATRENGCLQVIPGSHRYGRVEHVTTGEQAGADPERVEQILQREERVFAEMEPGDVIFFHANLLHRSDQNLSDRPRWSMVCCYNAKENEPYQQSRHPGYSPISIVEDTDVLSFDGDETGQDWHTGSVPTSSSLESQ